MGYRKTYNRLSVASLTPGQHSRTCGYWYVVHADGSMPHTAFATKEHLQAWAAQHGLNLPTLPEKRGEHSYGAIHGSYSDESHTSLHDFNEIMPRARRVMKLSNGDYTLGLLVSEHGHRVVHYLNPNIHEREVFDYFKCRAEVG